MPPLIIERDGVEVNRALRRAPCPNCGAEAKRHSIRTRRLKDISLNGPVEIRARVGAYRCPNDDCPKKFFCLQPAVAVKGKHYTRRAIEKATVAVGEDKRPFTRTPHCLERDMAISPSISTVYHWFHEQAESIDLRREYELWAAEGFSGALAIDELYDDFTIFVATDPLNDKTLSFQLSDGPKLEELKKFVRHLKGLGIEPEVIATDEAGMYKIAPFVFWPGARHQLCLFHFTRKLTESVLNAVRAVARESKLKGGTRQDSKLIRKSRYPFVKRRENMTTDQADNLEDLCSRFAELHQVRRFMDDAFTLFERDLSPDEAWQRRDELVRWAEGTNHLKSAVSVLGNNTFRKVITFMSYDNCPRTTNHVERANRFYRKRAKSHYRNRTRRSIRNMLVVDLMIRKSRYQRERPVRLRRRVTSL